MDLGTTYRLADAFSYAVFFWCWVALGLVLGGVVYVLLVYPGARRAPFRAAGAVSRRIAVPAAAAVPVALGAVVYRTVCAGFFAVALREDRIELTHMLPTRTVSIPRDRVAAVKEALTLDKGMRRRLVIETHAGDRHESVSIPYYEMDRILSEVRAWRGRERR